MKEFESRNAREEIECAVCLEYIHLTEIAALRCGHTFHPLCVSQRVKDDQKCPVCKKQAQEDSIIPRLFFEINEKENSAMNEAAAIINEITSTLSKLDIELELIYLQIEHNSALLRIMSKMITACIKLLEKK
ncbi:hypothetical protein LOAG_09831 [Loa loa]|uniref:RING-type domain-containing protein n=1 Tax=Loa loa TaxID=7209 RepID=A0A1I7VBA9_LOALO|nr:hypothetical protein LOAG_09831 [Loa loa]EFO18663.2 hypothetical protein LOAG_09831 [Loa loa]